MEQQELQSLVEKISNTFFHRPFLHEARFNHRLRTTGGRYLLRTHDIELNYKYYKEQGLEALVGIIKHELCHYHLHIEGRGYKHRDRDFRMLMQEVGAPRFCKPLESKKAEYEHFYQCRNCGLEYRRKRRMNINKYVCGKCKGKLTKIDKDIDP